MTQQGTLGTPTRPTRIDTELLALLNADVTRLVGLGIDARDTDDGVIVFSGTAGKFTGEAVVWIDGTGYPLQSVEWVDSTGVARPVTEWHLGPLSSPTPPSVDPPTEVTFPPCSGVGVPSSAPDTVTVQGNTLDRRVVEVWDACDGPESTLQFQVYDSFTRVPPPSLSVQVTEDWAGQTV